MNLTLPVPDCCAPWEVAGSPQVFAAVSRTRLRCTGCGRRRVVTVTFATDRTAIDAPADVIPLRSIR